MNRKDFNRLNDISVSLGSLVSMVEIAEGMVEEYVCGDITDDKAKAGVHMDRLLALMGGIVEICRSREKDIDALLKSVSVNGDTPIQTKD
jgi:hypothetical protein